MKKIAALLLSALMILAVLSGCESRLAAGVRMQREADKTTEITKELIFSEEQGYHLHEIYWGITKDELSRYFSFTMNSLAGFSEDGSLTYKAENIRMTVHGRLIDEATITLTEGSECIQASVAFSSGDKSNKREGDPSEAELFDLFHDDLVSWFGEPDREDTVERVLQNTPVRYTTYYWDYTLSNGNVTEMQWAEAFVSTATEPSFTSLGFLLNPKTEETE